MTTSIRTKENEVDVVQVRERFDIDPDEPLIGTVHIWQQGGLIEVDVRGPSE